MEGLFGRHHLQAGAAQAVGRVLHRTQSHPTEFGNRGLHGHRQHHGLSIVHGLGLRRRGSLLGNPPRGARDDPACHYDENRNRHA